MTSNAASIMSRWAETDPERLVLVAARRRRGEFAGVTYGDFDRFTDDLAAGLRHLGVEAGMRAALLIHPDRGMFEAGYALMKAGAVPVLIDSGLGRARMGECLAEADVGAFLGVPEALAARRVLRWARGARILVTTGSGLARTPGLKQVAALGRGLPRVDPTAADGPAAIAFTSGSTGAPKGVEYTHAMFGAQAEMITDIYDIAPGEVNVATFGPFALLGPLLGMTTVLPRMDFANPGAVDPERVIEAVTSFEATMMFGSPALLDTVGRYGEIHARRLPSLRRVLSAGAPVRPEIQRRFLGMLAAGADIHTPYGATEALPVASIDSGTLSRIYSDDGPAAGVCVGWPASGVEVTLIPVTDRSVTKVHPTPPGAVGEIVVKGPNVSPAYHRRPEADRLSKVMWAGEPAHRMGDIGRFDEEGRLWFLGRKSHRVQMRDRDLYPIPVEAVFNTHPSVARSALVGLGPVGRQRPVVVVELEPGVKAGHALAVELLDLGASHPEAEDVTEVLFHRRFPVDVRHNSKIDRPALAIWAAGKVAP